MNNRLWTTIFASSLIGCIASPHEVPASDEILESSTQAIERVFSPPPYTRAQVIRPPRLLLNGLISTNSLSPGILGDSTLRAGLQRLATRKLAGDIVWTRLLDTDEGIELLSYAIGCALPPGTAISYEGRVFPGHFGLAPEWRNNPLTNKEPITACLMAHANAFDEAVSIAVSGRLPYTGPASSGSVPYPVEEAAFYGDIFASAAKMYACSGWQVHSCDQALFAADLRRRICGTGDEPCGFAYVGPCQSRSGRPGACTEVGTERRCTAPGSARTFHAVLTTNLKSTADLRELYPIACGNLP